MAETGEELGQAALHFYATGLLKQYEVSGRGVVEVCVEFEPYCDEPHLTIERLTSLIYTA